MKIIVERKIIDIIPESQVDIAYLEEVMGLKPTRFAIVVPEYDDFGNLMLVKVVPISNGLNCKLFDLSVMEYGVVGLKSEKGV